MKASGKEKEKEKRKKREEFYESQHQTDSKHQILQSLIQVYIRVSDYILYNYIRTLCTKSALPSVNCVTYECERHQSQYHV